MNNTYPYSFLSKKTTKEEKLRGIKMKMHGTWELMQFHFDNKLWNSDSNPNGRITFNAKSDFVAAAINTSAIDLAKDEEEFLKQIIFYFGEWKLELNEADEIVSIHKVSIASSPARIGVAETRKVEFTSEDFLKLTGIHPATKKPIELIWKKISPESEKITRLFLIETYQPNNPKLDNAHGVVFLTSSGNISFNLCNVYLQDIPSQNYNQLFENIIFFYGRFKLNEKQEDFQNNDLQMLSCDANIVSASQLKSSNIEICLPNKDEGLLVFQCADKRFTLKIFPFDLSNENQNKPTI